MSGNIDNLENIISMYDNVLIFSLVDARQLRSIKKRKGSNIKIKRKKKRKQRKYSASVSHKHFHISRVFPFSKTSHSITRIFSIRYPLSFHLRLVSSLSFAFVPNSITRRRQRNEVPSSANDRLGGLCNFQNEITEFLEQEKLCDRTSRVLASLFHFLFPSFLFLSVSSFSLRYLWYTP